LVWKQIEALLTKPEVIWMGLEEKQNDSSKVDTYLKELDTVRGMLRHLEKGKDRTWKAFALTGDESTFSTEIKGIMARIDELENKATELEKRIEVNERAEIDIEGIQRFCQLARANLGNFSFGDKRLALEALDIKVWLDGENATIEGSIPVASSDIASTIA